MANYIIYLDANNLYGYGMSQALATGDFNWEINELEEKKILANFEKNEDLTKFTKSNYIIYLDANNLYGYGMSQALATGDFNWETDLEYFKTYLKIAVV